jgi:hypothetical protein
VPHELRPHGSAVKIALPSVPMSPKWSFPSDYSPTYLIFSWLDSIPKEKDTKNIKTHTNIRIIRWVKEINVYKIGKRN